MKSLLLAACCVTLAACSPMREPAVKPLTTAMDEAAMQAGELRIAASALAAGAGAWGPFGNSECCEGCAC